MRKRIYSPEAIRKRQAMAELKELKKAAKGKSVTLTSLNDRLSKIEEILGVK